MSEWLVTVLGQVRASRHGVAAPLCGRSRRLVALAAVRGPVTRTCASGLLWPASGEEPARASLRSALAAVRRAAPGLLLDGEGEIAVADGVEVDLDAFRRSARAVQQDPSLVLPLALDLLPGGAFWPPLLAGWEEDWAVVERERCTYLLAQTLGRCSRNVLDGVLGAPSGTATGPDDAVAALTLAEDLARAEVGLDPLRESARRRLIRVLLAAGDEAAAVAEADDFTRLLMRRAGLRPSPHLAALMDAVRPQPASGRRH